MNKKVIILLSVTLFGNVAIIPMISSASSTKNTFGKPYFLPRSQGDNLARRMVGEEQFLNRCDIDHAHGALSLTIEPGQSFGSNQFGQYFSFRQDSNVMRFRGPLAPNFDPATTDVDAVNFLLPNNFDGTVALTPRIQFVVADFNFRLNLDQWLSGLYMDIGLPVEWLQVNLKLSETIITSGSNISFPAVTTPVPPIYSAPAPYTSITEAWKGIFTGNVLFFDALNDEYFQATINAMGFATNNGKQHKTRPANLNFAFGYNFFCTDAYLLGISFRFGAPTGNIPGGEYVFEPIVGDGHHWKVGGGLSAHATLWNNGCDQSYSLWFEGAAYHLCKADQIRTFDLKGNGVGSRYLLLKMFNADGNFNGQLVPGPNVTTLGVQSSYDITGEANFMLDYRYRAFTFNLGYGLWGRSKEKLNPLTTVSAATYGIMGGTPLADAFGVADNDTNSTAQINGTNYTQAGDAATVFLTTSNIDIIAAETPAALSHKIFTHGSYIWETHEYFALFIGIGGEVELSGKHNNAINQWGVWAKGGVTFS